MKTKASTAAFVVASVVASSALLGTAAAYAISARNERAGLVMDCMLLMERMAPPEISDIEVGDAFPAAHRWCSDFVERGGAP